MQRRKAGRASGPLPPQLSDIPDTASDMERFEDRASYTQQRWAGLDLVDQEAEDVSINQLIVADTRLLQARMRLLQATDARFEVVDLAGSMFEKAYMRRVELHGCRLMGTTFMDADLEDLRLTRCTANLMRIWTTRCRTVRFEHCALREASFDGSDLSGVVFDHCDLSGADFRNAKLKGADIRSSTITDLKVTGRDLAGLIVDPSQALQLIQLFGVVVRSPGSEE